MVEVIKVMDSRCVGFWAEYGGEEVFVGGVF